ncbi:MAG TPA: arginine--tRNA ligase [Syntrophaceae bacterium]|jgi:arginyl-tRNA synthetase|nr:arginine--tRNA ligase [Syntrophaceae bacterium]
MKSRLRTLLGDAVKACVSQDLLEIEAVPLIEIDITKDAAFGDYASNIAMVLASRVKGKLPPRKVAEVIRDHIRDNDGVLERVDIAGPGFMNFFIREGVWSTLLSEVDNLGDCYGSSDYGEGKKIHIEFVSANPTGPLHIGHARGAVVGDVIANIQEAAGFSVFREYYINDAGNQMNNLGKSVLYRYLEFLGDDVEFPESCYQGDYIKEIAREIIDKHGGIYRSKDQEKALRIFTDYAAGAILDGIKEDLKAFGVVFDNYFSERNLYKDDRVATLIKELEEKHVVYSDGETLWFRTTDFGDEKDRVVVRRNGEPTYFAADIAYHNDKYIRGFDAIIDIWGADHHGYIPRMSACVEALGHEKNSLKIVLIQLVSLLRDGILIPMSTRAGEFVTLKEVVDEVGKDAARYNFLMRRSDSHLDFDLELAKKQSNENPVYYVQYAHARICSIVRNAEEKGYTIPLYDEVDLRFLKLPEEVNLIKAIIRFPEVVEGAAIALEPHRLTFYLNDLAALFHSYYNKHRVLSDEESLSKARLFLIKTILTVVRNALRLLGVSAPERM